MDQNSITYGHRPDPSQLVDLFRLEFCRKHQWPKEDPLEVVVDLGSRGGALHAIEKARRVMGEHLGDVRAWQELPVRHPHPCGIETHSILFRWRSLFRLRGAITRSLYARCQRNKRQKRIRPRCSFADTRSRLKAFCACSRLGTSDLSDDWGMTDRAGKVQQSVHTALSKHRHLQLRNCTFRMIPLSLVLHVSYPMKWFRRREVHVHEQRCILLQSGSD